MLLSLLGVCQAETNVSTDAELYSACRNAEEGEVIVVDTSGGRLDATCSLSAANVRVTAAEGLDYADVGVFDIQIDATGTTLERLRFWSEDEMTLVTSGAEDVVGSDLVFDDLPGQGLLVYSGDATIDGLQASGIAHPAALVAPEYGTATLTIRNAEVRDSEIALAAISNMGTVGTLVVEDSLFEDNEQLGDTATNGAAIQVYGSSVLTARRSVFRNNQAEYGGAIAVWSISGLGAATMEIEDSLFEGNRAIEGGAIRATDETSVTISGSHFCQNEATTDGSAILGSTASVTMTRSTFQANLGAASTVSLDEASLTLEHLSFVENADAWALSIGAGTTRLQHSLFNANTGTVTAGYSGGHNAYLGNGDVPAFVDATDLVEGEPGFLAPYDPSDCGQLPYIAEDSMLVGAGESGTEDPDGTSPADIGAWWAGAGENGGDTGGGSEEAVPTSSQQWFSGGCATGSAPWLLSWLLLALSRRRSR